VTNQPDGTITLDDLRAAIRGDDQHFPPTRLISLENTHNRCGGVALTAEYTRAVGELAHEHGLALHLDGARIFNAAAALGVRAAELAAPADSVTFCLSKGLCAPVGSVLCGSGEFIRRAQRIRKMVGGGMRQAGVLAAAGIVALETMPQRLADDHRRARQLAEGLAAIPGIQLDPGSPHTNMIFLNLTEGFFPDAPTLAAQFKAQGILIVPNGPRRLRLVTHFWIDDDAVAQVLAAFRQAACQQAA
jgi:threonine aldolase